MSRITPSIIALSCLLAASPAQAVLLGPSGGTGLTGEYASFADSPFSSVNFSGGYFYLENFEDGLLNTPGVSANNGGVTSVVFGPSIHDSVDLDDGVQDGSGLDGDSWFFASGSVGVTWTFDAVALGELPTHAGLVWTDGGGGATITFEAFDKDGLSLGTVTGAHADPSNNGETGEDRFYGVIDTGGISAIRLSHSSGGIELDHLQYGNPDVGSTVQVPAPATMVLLALGLLGAGFARRVH